MTAKCAQKWLKLKEHLFTIYLHTKKKLSTNNYQFKTLSVNF